MIQREAVIIFAFIFMLSFPVIGYSITTLAMNNQVADTSLDADALASAGLTLYSGVSHNITYNDPAVEYVIPDKGIYRIRWFNVFAIGDKFLIQKRSNPVDRLLGSWWFPTLVRTSFNNLSDEPRNATVINYFNQDYNWTRATLLNEGLIIFWTIDTVTSSNITEAIMEDGFVTVTIAQPFDTTAANFNWFSVASWYMGLLIGDQTFGLPPIFSWVIRIITGIMFIAAVWFVRDLLPL